MDSDEMDSLNTDYEDLDCPQYVRFSSESFQAALNSDTKSSDSMEQSHDLSIISTEENFVVHHNAAENKVLRAKRKVTVPQPFRFKTDDRVKKNNEDVISHNDEKDFSCQLRKPIVSQQNGARFTKVKPFKLTESKKRKLEETEYLPLAEQIKAYQQKTPDRYHCALNQEFKPQDHWSPQRLRPRTPKLQAVKRHRVVNALSREELEAKEIEEMKAFQFHARPVDPRVYKPDCIQKTSRKITITKAEIQLKTAERAKINESVTTEENKYKFRARPVPKNILAGPTGLGEKPEVIKTIPNPPQFSTDARLKRRKIMEQEHQDKEIPAKKAKKQPKIKLPTPTKPKQTEVQPFTFDKNDKERFLRKNEKIREEIEKENKPFIFKAQLMPSPGASALPQVKKKEATKPIPFNFNLDKRNLKEHSFVQEENISFKAKPATVLQKLPFVPEKPLRSSIDIQEFQLSTDRRASERLKLKEQKDLEDMEKEKMLLLQKASEELKEREEISRLRQELVHKANPIRQFKTLELKKSSKPLTVPISPKFETDIRLQVKHQ